MVASVSRASWSRSSTATASISPCNPDCALRAAARRSVSRAISMRRAASSASRDGFWAGRGATSARRSRRKHEAQPPQGRDELAGASCPRKAAANFDPALARGGEEIAPDLLPPLRDWANFGVARDPGLTPQAKCMSAPAGLIFGIDRTGGDSTAPRLTSPPPSVPPRRPPGGRGRGSPLVGGLLDHLRRRLAAAVAGLGLDADQRRVRRRPGTPGARAANLKLCAGTTRSSWSAVVTSVGGIAPCPASGCGSGE